MSEQATIFELPYNLFLMQRMEFVVACGDHLAANVMRVIEAEMIKRKEAWQVRVEKALEEKKPLPKEPKAWWVRLSQAQIIARLYMFDSAKLKKPEGENLNSREWIEYRFKRALSISKATLKKAIELLKALGFLIEKSKPGDEFGAPIYTLNKDSVQEAIKKLPANPFTIFHHLGGVENIESGGDSKNFNVPPQNSDSGESQIFSVPPEKISSGESQNFRVDIDSRIDSPEDIEIDNEEEDTYPPHSQDAGDSGSAIASPTRAPIFFALLPWLWVDSKETPSKLLVQFAGTLHAGEQQRRLQILEHYQQMFQAKGFTPLVELVTQPPEHTEDFAVLPPSLEAECEQVLAAYAPTDRDTHTREPVYYTLDQGLRQPWEEEPSQENVYTNSQREDGSVYSAGDELHAPSQQLSTAAVSYPRASAKVATGKRSQKKSEPTGPDSPSTITAMPPADAEWKTTTCLQLFTYWRGHPLLSRYQNMRASQCAKALAQNYTREQVEQVRKYMVEDDPWWSQHPEKVDVCSVAEHIHEKLAEMVRAKKPKEASGQRRQGAGSQPKDPGQVLWYDSKTGEQRMMTYAEADEHGWEGGFGEFIQHTNYGKVGTR